MELQRFTGQRWLRRGLHLRSGLQFVREIRVDERDCFTNASEHAERKHIDLQHAERFDVIFVPLNDCAPRHCCIFNGDGFINGASCDDEAADMLGTMPRESENAARNRCDALPERNRGIKSHFAQTCLFNRTRVPWAECFAETREQFRSDTEYFSDIAHRAPRTIGDHFCGERCTMTAVLCVEVLHDLFAALMFEVDIDIRRLVSLSAHESFEQDINAIGVHRSNAE